MLSNLLRLSRGNRHLDPRVAIYYVTEQCNLNCAYCEDFGARRNPATHGPAPLETAISILRVARGGSDALFLTGGEPLTHPDIDQIVLRARQELRFREITMISNGSLLAKHPAILPRLDRLIISLDCLHPDQWSQTIGAPIATAENIIANIREVARLQKDHALRLIINTVLTPETLPGAMQLLDFALETGTLISFSPQAVNNWPRYELSISADYKSFIEKLIQFKQHGAPIVGSEAYLQSLLMFQPYDCYPALAPRIYPNGDLSYPCRPIEKAGGGQGGRQINLLAEGSWEKAWQNALQTYGQPPRTCHSCFQQCYAEPSLMLSHPMGLLYEWMKYPTSRAANLATYAPG